MFDQAGMVLRGLNAEYARYINELITQICVSGRNRGYRLVENGDYRLRHDPDHDEAMLFRRSGDEWLPVTNPTPGELVIYRVLGQMIQEDNGRCQEDTPVPEDYGRFRDV